jgi:citrate synthase
MHMTDIDIRKGLEGVVADTTSISHVDGAKGRLYYRGYPIETLARHRFAAVAHLVVFGSLPDEARLSATEEYLWEAGRLPPEVAASLRTLTRHGVHPVTALQSVTPLLFLDPPALELGRTQEEEQGLVVAARLPAAIAVIHAALRDVPEPSYPRARRYGERYLQLMTGREPAREHIDAFECMQVLQLEHSFNASTFTARTVTSTLAPPAAAIAAAIGALYGPLHGGADQAAVEMAYEIGDVSQAARFVTHALSAKRTVMGMGHREYRVVDPRARIIKAIAARIAEGEQRRLFEILSAVDLAFVEQTANRPRALRANLEFYKGVVCLSLGLAKEFFTATFAAARAFGWVAHIAEQRQNNRIIRPSAHYVGPALIED